MGRAVPWMALQQLADRRHRKGDDDPLALCKSSAPSIASSVARASPSLARASATNSSASISDVVE